MKWAARAYFRIQEKHLTCSKRASYIRNTSWPDSPRLMKVSVTIGLRRLSSFHIPSCTFSISSRRFWEYLDDRRNRNLEIFTLFSRNWQIPRLTCKMHRKSFFKNSVKVSPPWFSEGNFRFYRTSKTPVLSFCEYICLKKKNIERKNTSSQWLVPFREIRPCKLSLQIPRVAFVFGVSFGMVWQWKHTLTIMRDSGGLR